MNYPKHLLLLSLSLASLVFSVNIVASDAPVVPPLLAYLKEIEIKEKESENHNCYMEFEASILNTSPEEFEAITSKDKKSIYKAFKHIVLNAKEYPKFARLIPSAILLNPPLLIVILNHCRQEAAKQAKYSLFFRDLAIVYDDSDLDYSFRCFHHLHNIAATEGKQQKEKTQTYLATMLTQQRLNIHEAYKYLDKEEKLELKLQLESKLHPDVEQFIEQSSQYPATAYQFSNPLIKHKEKFIIAILLIYYGFYHAYEKIQNFRKEVLQGNNECLEEEN